MAPFNMNEAFQKLLKKLRPNQKRKTILFVALDSLGHINSLISIANYLRSQNHRTVFLLIEPIENKLKQAGHEVYDSMTPDLVESVNSDTAQDKWNVIIKDSREVWMTGDPVKNIEFELTVGFGAMIDDIKKYNSNIEKKMELIKPDILIFDHYFGIPALFKNPDLPWIRIFSAAPLGLHNHPDLPQAWLGYPTKWDKNDSKLVEGSELALKVKQKLYDSYNEYWRSFSYPDLPTNPISYVPVSPHLNIYMYPEELDYASEYPLNDWKRCDCLVRDSKAGKFELPANLRDKPGKLIFLSLGSLASAEVDLMKRITSLLADCPHKFIVCKGPLHDQYELPDNMWGEKFVPQLEVLTCVDLIITHGGNNSITESFYYGVPGFIVCPLFGDQYDNATRIQEKGLGIRLDPYNSTKEDFHNAIETILHKTDVKDKMKIISERMRKPEVRNRALKLVNDFVAKH